MYDFLVVCYIHVLYLYIIIDIYYIYLMYQEYFWAVLETVEAYFWGFKKK